MAETDQERLVRILATSLTDRIEWALSLEARLAALEAGGGGGGSLPGGGSNGQFLGLDVDDVTPQWQDLPDITGQLHSAGVVQLISHHFGFDEGGSSAALAAGVDLYVPTPGDVLVALWIEIGEAWDGTTPLGDVGQFTAGQTGIFASMLNHDGAAVLDMTAADNSAPLIGGDALIGSQLGLNSAADISAIPALVGVDGLGPGLTFPSGTLSFARILPARFTSGAPIKAVVSTDGTTGGGDPGSTQGSASVRMLIVGT